MQAQVVLKALNPSMKDIKESVLQHQSSSIKSAPASYLTEDEERPSRNDEEPATDLRTMEKLSILMEDVGAIDVEQEEGEDFVDCISMDTADDFWGRPENWSNENSSPSRNCATPLLVDQEPPLSLPVSEALSESPVFCSSSEEKKEKEPLPLPQRLSTCQMVPALFNKESNQISCCDASRVTIKSPSPVSVTHMTELQRNDVSSSPPPALPSMIVFSTLSPSSAATSSTTTSSFCPVSPPSPLDSTETTMTLTVASSPSRKRSLAAMSTTEQGKEHGPKRPKLTSQSRVNENEHGQQGASMKMTGNQDYLCKELLAHGSSTSSDHQYPNLLEIAVGYGFHLARVRLMHEQNNAELTGILNPSRRVQDIFEHGAQMVVRMKEQERLLFWKYMNETPPPMLQRQTRAKTTQQQQQ